MSEPYWVPLGAAPAPTVIAYGEMLAEAIQTANQSPIVGGAYITPDTNAYAYDGSPVTVEFFCPYVEVVSGATSLVHLYMDGASLGQMGIIRTAMPIMYRRRFSPAAGSHTFRAWSSSSHATVFNCGAGGAGVYFPMYLRVLRG